MGKTARRALIWGAVVASVGMIAASVVLRDAGTLTDEELAPVQNLLGVDDALRWRGAVEAALPEDFSIEGLERDGYISFREDVVLPWVHYGNWTYIEDDRILDPSQPEAYLFRILPDGERELVAMVFMLPRRYTYANTPDIADGSGMWHLHPNLCLAGDPFEDPELGWLDQDCPEGANFPRNLMVHAWIAPNACGPFAAEFLPTRTDTENGIGTSFDAADRNGLSPGCDQELAERVWPEEMRP